MGGVVSDSVDKDSLTASSAEVFSKMIDKLDKQVQQDISQYGISIFNGGERVDPKDFFKDPKDLIIDSLKEKLAEKERLLQKAVEGLEHNLEYFEFNKKEIMASQTKGVLEEIRSSVGGGK